MWWNIQQIDDGQFEIWADGGPRIFAKNRQTGPNGITGELYQNVLRQLAATGKARIKVRLGQFFQI